MRRNRSGERKSSGGIFPDARYMREWRLDETSSPYSSNARYNEGLSRRGVTGFVR